MNQTIYPIGIQNFEKIRKDGYLYIDKTALIYQLVKNRKLLFPQPPASIREESAAIHDWRPISKGKRSCSRDWPWRSWRKSGPSIRSCIST